MSKLATGSVLRSLVVGAWDCHRGNAAATGEPGQARGPESRAAAWRGEATPERCFLSGASGLRPRPRPRLRPRSRPRPQTSRAKPASPRGRERKALFDATRSSVLRSLQECSPAQPRVRPAGAKLRRNRASHPGAGASLPPESPGKHQIGPPNVRRVSECRLRPVT